MNSKIKRSIACLAVAVGLGACGGGSSSGPAPAPNNPFGGIDKAGFANTNGGAYDNFQVVTIDPVAMTITIAFPLTVAPVTAPQIGVALKDIPGGYITIQPDANGNWSASLTIPLKDLGVGVINFGAPAPLPNGQPLPGGLGSLPMLHITDVIDPTTTLDFYLYGGTSTGNNTRAIAIFYPTPKFNNPVTVVFPVLNKAQTKVLGHLGLIGTLGTFPSGIYGDYLIPASLPTTAPAPTPTPNPTPNPIALD